MSSKNNKFETKKVELQQSVLIVGGGIAGIHASKEISNLGYKTTMVEQSDKIGGQITHNKEYGVDYEKMLSGVDVLTESSLKELSGNIGSFTAKVQTPQGEKTYNTGAVVVSTGNKKECNGSVFDEEKIVSISDLVEVIPGYPVKDQRRPVSLILDLKIEETKASSEMVLNIAIDFRKKYGCEVYVFCREVRVSSLYLEILYDEARDAGVTIIKYDGEVTIQKTENEVLVTANDTLLDSVVEVSCHLAGVSTYGIHSCIDNNLAEIAGISTDIQDHMQDNNVHLFPGLTNRPGIFIAGACRGQYYIPQIITDAKATALAVHTLLSQKSIEVELSNAIVDEDKCVLCLTCIRSCPHKAMIVNAEKKIAESAPEACQRCGICAGECPAKAIKLPEYTDEELLRQVD